MVHPKEKLTSANINQVNNGMFSFYLYNRYGNIVGSGVVALVYLIDHALNSSREYTNWKFSTGLYIGGHSLISLFRALSMPVLNLSKKLILIEIEFLTFLIGWKLSFAYQCINGRFGFSG